MGLTEETVYVLAAALHALAEPATQQRFALLHPALFSLWREGATPSQIESDPLYRSFWDAPALLVPIFEHGVTGLVAVCPRKRVLELYIANEPPGIPQTVAEVRFRTLSTTAYLPHADKCRRWPNSCLRWR